MIQNKRIKTGLLLLFISILPLTCYLQEIKFQHISPVDGLSQSTINGIVQDKYGFLWIGTEDGLNKYDGFDFEVFRHDPVDTFSISDSYIITLFKDQSEDIWVGTDRGLNKYDFINNRFIHYYNEPTDKNSLDHSYINEIYEAYSLPGVLWIGTKKGLNKFDLHNQQFTHFPQLFSSVENQNNDLINCIYEAPSEPGILWIGSNGGLFRYNYQTNEFSDFLYDADDKYGLSNNSVKTIYEDSNNNLWVGTVNGLNILDRKTKQFKVFINNSMDPFSIGHNSIWTIFEDTKENLWFGTYGGGLSLFNEEEQEFINYIHEPDNQSSLSNNSVFCIFEDDSGILWFGTETGGLNKVIPNANKFRHYYHKPNNQNSLVSNNVRSIIFDKNKNLWIGTYGGITCINEETQQFKHYTHEHNNPNSLASNLVRALFEDKSGNIWIGTRDAGLTKFEPKKNKFTNYQCNEDSTSINSNYVRAIYEDEKGYLWIGTVGGGLNRFDPQTGTFKQYECKPTNSESLSDNRVYKIIQDNDGMLWMGTDEGLVRLNPETGELIQYQSQPNDINTLSHNLIMTLYQDDSGYIWVGTYGGGLNKFDPKTEKFTRFTEKDGLPNNTIYGILSDELGNLWLSTNRGISMFNPSEISFKNYDLKDGLQDYEFNSGAYCKGQQGNIYFGGISGISKFNPNDLENRRFIPPVVITDFQLFNKPVSINEKYGNHIILNKSVLETEEIELSHQENVFSFNFASLDYVYPEKNKYAYMLEGFDNDWNYVENRRFVNYTSLPAGKYNFKVKGTNSDGVWNETGDSIRIIITPPWWKTIWFYTILIILIISFIAAYIKWRERKLKNDKIVLEENVKSRTLEIHGKNITLHKQKSEILTQNQEIQQQNEEIKSQTEELKTVNEHLLELDHFKEGMTAMIVHDLKNPLSTIIGLSEKQEVQQAGNQMLNMVLNILDVQKFEDTEVKLQLGDFPITRVINDALKQVQLLLDRKSIEIKQNIDTNTKLHADFDITNRVLVNILSNAIKYTSNNGKITINAQPLDNSNFVKISISDTGEGIPEDKLSSVFDKFSQVDAKKSGGVASTGLGLAFCKLAIQAHGGKIGVNSGTKQGATFWFLLPLADVLGRKFNEPEREQINEEKIDKRFSDSDITYLSTFAESLKEFTVYEFSDIISILNKIESPDHAPVYYWKTEIENAVRACNESKYNELLKLNSHA